VIGSEPRIGVTRRPLRGVPKSQWVRDGDFDAWLPALAPSAKLLGRVKKRNLDEASVRKAFFDTYERELLGTAEGRQTVQLR